MSINFKSKDFLLGSLFFVTAIAGIIYFAQVQNKAQTFKKLSASVKAVELDTIPQDTIPLDTTPQLVSIIGVGDMVSKGMVS